MWDFISTLMGFVLGMICILVIMWACYIERVFVFSYCPSNYPTCSKNDYYTDPGEAMAETGVSAKDILWVNNSGELVYKRVLKSSSCTPNHNQDVVISYPQQCDFTYNGAHFIGISEGFGSNTYDIKGPNIKVKTAKNCKPLSPSSVSTGKPLALWTPVESSLMHS